MQGTAVLGGLVAAETDFLARAVFMVPDARARDRELPCAEEIAPRSRSRPLVVAPFQGMVGLSAEGFDLLEHHAHEGGSSYRVHEIIKSRSSFGISGLC